MWQVPYPFHLQCGTWESLYVVRSRCFLCTFFVAGNFRSDFSCHPFLFHLICLFFLKMGWRPSCPDGNKKKKKKKEKKSSEMDKDKDKDRSTRKETKTKRNTSLGGGSAHRDQSTGNSTADTMIQCINEIIQVKVEAAANNEPPKLSWNVICRKYGHAPGNCKQENDGKGERNGPTGVEVPGEGESLIKVSFSFIFQVKQSPCFQGLGVICGSTKI